MAEARIPVDLFNPGQVFACLGLMEAAEVLLGNAEGAFDWRDTSRPAFILRATGEQNPMKAILDFLKGAKIHRILPQIPEDHKDEKLRRMVEKSNVIFTHYYNSYKIERMFLPVCLSNNGTNITIDHWSDKSHECNMRMYSGNRDAYKIINDMIFGSEKQNGIIHLYEKFSNEAIDNPFNVIIAPLGGTFNFDVRGTWQAIDLGYSPDQQKQKIVSSPLVEIMAALGLQNTRPNRKSIDTEYYIYYGVWRKQLPPSLARAALACCKNIAERIFACEEGKSGKNTILSFAKEET